MASTIELILSTKGLAIIPESESRNDFEFLVGNSRYLCPSLIADFLSPLLCRLHSVDETLRSIRIATKDDHSQFGDFIHLGRGFPLVVTDANRSFLISVCAELENRELHKFVVVSSGSDISCSNVVERINSLEGFGCDVGAEICFAASHFFEISSSDLSSLSFSAFEEIARHADLKVSSEDSLFEFICEHISSNSQFFEVFQFVRFEFLSVANLTKFFDLVCGFFDRFTISHWASLRSRLLLPVAAIFPLPSGRGSLPGRLFPFRSSSPLDGIISHLASKFGGNVQDRSAVTITANRVYSSDASCAAKNAADLGTDSYFCSANEPNQLISFNFGNLTILPTHYSLRMHSPSPNYSHLKNWCWKVRRMTLHGLNLTAARITST
jgi:hypothetical protein